MCSMELEPGLMRLRMLQRPEPYTAVQSWKGNASQKNVAADLLLSVLRGYMENMGPTL